MNKKWEILPPISDDIKNQFPEINHVILQLLNNRGIKTQEQIDEFLKPDYGQDIHSPFLFRDMKKVVKRIFKAIEKKEKITVYGDYDVDGVTSSVLLSKTLKELGAKVNVYIPHRETEGYGMNPDSIKYISSKKTNLIITVDCGSANAEEVKLAKKQGVDVIVTDHHEEPLKTPEAIGIINPKFKDSGYPFRDLAGVGVVFKLVQALVYEDSKTTKKLKPGYEKWHLDLVALGTVCDSMPLIGENRTLVYYGLIVLNKTRNEGLGLLAQKAGIWHEETGKLVNAENLGFVLGPRINSAGRLDHANVAFKLLNSSNQEEIDELSSELSLSNTKRQKLTEKVINSILESEMDEKDSIIIHYAPDIVLGIVGLVAGKICDRFYKPTIIITKLPDRIAGSGRSFAEFDLMEGLKKFDKFFIRYGGHAQACGFVLKDQEALEDFTKKFKEYANKKLAKKKLVPKIKVDAVIELNDVCWELIEELERFEPLGQANWRPVFIIKGLYLDEIRVVGKQMNHLKLKFFDKEINKTIKAIGFKLGDEINKLKYQDKVDVAFYLQVNQWNGTKNIEFEVIDIKKV